MPKLSFHSRNVIFLPLHESNYSIILFLPKRDFYGSNLVKPSANNSLLCIILTININTKKNSPVNLGHNFNNV